jgi:hypothetical protein
LRQSGYAWGYQFVYNHDQEQRLKGLLSYFIMKWQEQIDERKAEIRAARMDLARGTSPNDDQLMAIIESIQSEIESLEADIEDANNGKGKYEHGKQAWIDGWDRGAIKAFNDDKAGTYKGQAFPPRRNSLYNF